MIYQLTVSYAEEPASIEQHDYNEADFKKLHPDLYALALMYDEIKLVSHRELCAVEVKVIGR